jgi:preprotein translocase subunit SecG
VQKKTTDFLEKATWRLAIILIVLSLASSYILRSGPNTNETEKEIIGQELIDQAPAVPNLPSFPTAE